MRTDGGLKKADEPKQWVRLDCDCGAKSGQYLGHYDLCRCVCGKWFWALQEKRGGPLVAYVWPGDASMERARRERNSLASGV
jgi:hypothetical protein